MDATEHLTKAISIRDKVQQGTESQEWVRQKAQELVEDGFWNNPQVGAICGYARQSIGRITRGAEKPAQRPEGGTLAPEVLDVLLELRGAVLRQEEVPSALVLAAIQTGTSTKLIARVSGVSIGTVLYVQRNAKRAEEVDRWLSGNAG